VPVIVRRPDAGETHEEQELPSGFGHDLHSMLIALRGWDAPPGTKTTLDVFRSRYVWRSQLVVGGYETVVTRLGALPCVRLDGISRRLTRAGEIDGRSDTRHFSMWITDDGDRVPVLMVARTDFGNVRMEIVEYQSGSGRRFGSAPGGVRLGAGDMR